MRSEDEKKEREDRQKNIRRQGCYVEMSIEKSKDRKRTDSRQGEETKQRE